MKLDTDRTTGHAAAQETELTAVSANDSIFAVLQPVRTLVLDTGATRIKRSKERQKSDELWQGVGFGIDAPTEGIPLYVRVGPNPALVAELLCGVLAQALKLPAPEVYLVQVPPGHMPRSKLANGKQTTLCVGTRDIGGDTFAQLLHDQFAAAAPLLRDWPDLPRVVAFDEWLANPDRNMGNLLYVAQTIYIIDHAEAFGGSSRELYPLSDLTDMEFTNLLGGFMKCLEAKKLPPLLDDMGVWLKDIAAITDIPAAVNCAVGAYSTQPEQKRELIDFITKRLSITHTLLCRRLGHPQLTLAG
jgi:hypothetical protein